MFWKVWGFYQIPACCVRVGRKMMELFFASSGGGGHHDTMMMMIHSNVLMCIRKNLITTLNHQYKSTIYLYHLSTLTVLQKKNPKSKMMNETPLHIKFTPHHTKSTQETPPSSRERDFIDEEVRDIEKQNEKNIASSERFERFTRRR